MEIAGDVSLKGSNWRKAIEGFAPFLPLSLQPNYSLYTLSIAIGIMYDKQLDIAGDENDIEKESRPAVPRSILYSHNTELDFLFQTAILTSKLIDYDEDTRMKIAFGQDSDIKFNKFEFLSKFANFGVGKLLEQLSDDNIETMENIKKFISSSVEGYNYELDEISEDDLKIEDLED